MVYLSEYFLARIVVDTADSPT